jgi:hypothetical protein
MLYFQNIKRFVISGSGSKDGTVAVWFGNRISDKRTIISSMKKMLDSDYIQI